MSKYELLERIGVGGMAEIYRGRSLGVGGFEKPVAIKKILPHLGRDERFVQMLIHEARINASLRQRNIVQIYDVGVGDDGEYFLVMEYVPGRDLAAVIGALERGGRWELPLDVALFIGGELCEALDHAHRAADQRGKAIGLIHRDVSPANVLISYAGEVKLTDFGIAKKVDEQSVVASIKGKFAYMSPEQAGARPLDARTDIFSLGVMLWELAMGRRLFSGHSDFDALRMVREGRWQRPRDIDSKFDPGLERIILHALATKPDERYSKAADLGADLRDARFRLGKVADPAAALAAIVTGLFPPDVVEQRATPAAGVPGLPAGPPPTRQGSVVQIATAAGFPFQGPGAAIAPDAALSSLLAAAPAPIGASGIDFGDDQTRLLRKAPERDVDPPPRPPAPPAKSKPPAPPAPVRASKAPKPPKSKSSTGDLRQARSAALASELFGDLSSVSQTHLPPVPGELDDAATSFHDSREAHEDEDDEAMSRLKLAVLVGAVSVIVVAVVVYLSGLLG